MKTLGIILGYRCNFKCEHCITGEKTEKCLTDTEKKQIVAAVQKYRPKDILFIGGEPTLYIPDMNEIVSGVGDLKTEIWMTTNGHFAVNKTKAKKVLSQIPKLTGLNLSYDNLHAKFLPEVNIENLYSACKDMGIKFDILMSVRSPMDLLIVTKLSKVGKFPVRVQKLLPVGAAKANNLGFKYPSFDENVFSACCPSKNKVIYMCGQGFTVCCSSLAFGANISRVVYPTMEQLLSSDFYKLISTHTLGAIMKGFGLSGMTMLPEHSEPCVLCESVFKSKFGADL